METDTPQDLARRYRRAAEEARTAKLQYQVLRDSGHAESRAGREALKHFEACDTRAALLRWLHEKSQNRATDESAQ